MPDQQLNTSLADLVLQQPVTSVRGVGPRLEKLLQARGLTTIEDLLFNLPLGYLDQRGGVDIGRLRPGEYVSFVATLVKASEVRYRRRKVFEAVLTDGSGLVTAKWFHYGGWLSQRLRRFKGKLRVSGTLRVFAGKLEVHHPDLEEVEGSPEEAGAILPRYSPIPGIPPRTYRRIIEQVVETYVPHVPETLPPAVRDYFHLLDLQASLREVHFPTDMPDRGELSPGLHRLIFEELFFLELQIVRGREELARQTGHAMTLDRDFLRRVGKLLPFPLTEAQRRVMREIAADLAESRPMNRLVQGDVGCGKTIVALLTALIVVVNGFQAAVMAPTEILAHQHLINMEPYARALDIPLTLLTARLQAREKQSRTKAIARGEARLVIGTHALIQEHVAFHRLGLVIMDEQHRFGVMQRLALRRKGGSPHVLVMTATPIPRTLAMTLYGDLEVSVIDELPPGRTPVETRVVDAADRERVYEIIRREFTAGRQAFIIYPLVEESEKSDLKDVTSMTAELQQRVFPGIGIAMVHGRMPAEEKQAVMEAFVAKRVKLLVATTVIEVGIDVPEATVIVIEHPERFGLSQLHQLRGRVGRGGDRSFCFLIHEGGGPETRERLAIMEETNDGFRIAEEDLRLRGPGDLIGLRQSGLADLRLANLVRDATILSSARRAALALFQKDPEIGKPAHAAIRAKLERQSRRGAELLQTS
jgi:ATP-dependent DNA helicase RecG